MELHDLNPAQAPTRAWLLVDEPTGKALLVDPALDHVSRYIDYVTANRLQLVAVVDTHTHADHFSGASEVSVRLGTVLAMHHQAPRGCVDRRLRHGDLIEVGATTVSVLATPGHTQDSISLQAGDLLLAGDLLGVGSRGHGGEGCADDDALQDSLRILERLDPTTRVYCTHDRAQAGPQPLLTALARMVNPVCDSRSRVRSSRMGTGFTPPSDHRTQEILRSNTSCAPRLALATGKALGDTVTPERITAAQLAAQLGSAERPQVIDVRSPAEFEEDGLGRIPDSLLVPLNHIEAEAENLRLLGGAIVVSCRSTTRSMLGAQLLQRAGLEGVRVLEGGILAWRAQGLPVEID